jgi:3-methyladenine DNA glycosylase AlkD
VRTAESFDPAAVAVGVRSALASVADADDIEPMAAYMKHRFPFLGVKTPARRAAIRPLLSDAEDWTNSQLLGVAEALMAQPERELSYAAADLLRKWSRHLRSDDLTRIRSLIETRPWWDTVDALAVHVLGPVIRADRRLQVEMDRWISADDMWIGRSAILHQLLWKDDTDADRLFHYCDLRAGDPEFFIRKALGWALRQYARTDPDAVRAYVDANADRLSALTKKEATRHL